MTISDLIDLLMAMDDQNRVVMIAPRGFLTERRGLLTDDLSIQPIHGADSEGEQSILLIEV
jgi:hypothetical protein